MTLMMKANRVHEFGGPEAIAYEDMPRPAPAKDQVLVRLYAAGVGPWDAWVRSGRSAIAQTLPLTPGSDVAGIVEEAGSSDSLFVPGDEVYGVTNPQFTGGYAEYAVAMSGMLALKPRHLDFIEAASVPVIAVTAWQMLFEHAAVARGQRILVHGGAGNVGAYAVQLARAAGVHVFATALPSESEEARRLGAEDVIELGSPAQQRILRTLDAVIDTVGGPTQAALYPMLKPGGTLVSSVSQPDAELAKKHRVQALFFLVKVNTRTLTAIGEMLDSRRLQPRVGKVLPLSGARRAHEMLDGLRTRPAGKIVLAATGSYGESA